MSPQFQASLSNNHSYAIEMGMGFVALPFFLFPKHCCEHVLPNMSEELNIVWYELMQGSSCEEEEVECVVCICKVKDGEEVRELRCNHIFRRVCYDICK